MAETTDDEYLSSSASSWDESKEYNVQEVVAEKQVNGQTLYLVKWEDYSELHNTWEPKESFIASLSLELWESRKELERNGLEKPFDVERWEKRKRDHREKKKKQSKSVINAVKTATASRNVRSRKVKHIDTRLPSSSEDESYNSSEDSESSTKSAKFRRQSIADSSHKGSRYPSSLKKSLSGQYDLQSPAQVETHLPVQAIDSRQRPMPLPSNISGNTSATKRSKKLQAAASNKLEGRHSREDAFRKQMNPNKQRPVSDSMEKMATKAAVIADEPIQDHWELPSLSKQVKFQPIPRPSILGDNWNKSIRKAKNTEKAMSQDAVPYKTLAAQRRAEKRGRNEPEPDVAELDFMDLSKGGSIATSKPKIKPRQASMKEAIGSDSTAKGDSTLSGVSIQKPQTVENQLLVDDERDTEAVVRRRPPIVPVSTDRVPSSIKLDSRSDAEVDAPPPIPLPPGLVSALPPLRGASNLPRHSRDTTDVGSKAKTQKSDNANDRGVANNETCRLPDPLPFNALHGDIKPHTHPKLVHHPVYSRLEINSFSISVEFACATSDLRRLLLEEKDRARDAVIFPCTHSITSEEYQELLHKSESVYFGAGHIKDNTGKSSDGAVKHAKYELIQVASKLRSLRSAAMFFGKLFSLMIWPCGDTSWRFLDDLFTSDSKPTLLRFLARKPISIHTHYSKMGIVEEPRPQFGKLSYSTSQLVKVVLGFNWDGIINDGTTQHVFLLYYQRYRREHDLIYAVAKRTNLTVWSSLQPGHWAQFCTQVAGPPGQAKLNYQQKGVVIAHSLFSQYGHLPRLFRLISRGTRFFIIDVMQKDAKEQLLRGEYLTEVETTRQGRDRKKVKLLGSNANLQNCSVDLLYSIPPKMIAAEIFPIDRGSAVLLLDSVMVQNPRIACKVLRWFKLHGVRKRYRLVARPKLHEWISRVANELRISLNDTHLVSAWDELRDLATDLLIPNKGTDEESDSEEDDHPPIICLPSLNEFNEHCTYKAYSESPELVRDQDRKLFDLFAVWTVEEVRVFRRFQVLTAEREFKEFNEIFSVWTEKWRYIAMLTGEEYLSTLDT